MTNPRHLLTLSDLTPDEIKKILNRGIALKQMLHSGQPHRFLEQKVLVMIFEKSSTRTRVSFEAGMAQMGGHAIFLSSKDSQLGRGEPIADTARVLSSMCDAIMIRTFSHSTVQTLAEYSTVPIINGLTDSFHPCQLLADLMTFQELKGSISGKKVAWIGDGNNMCQSYIKAADLLDFELNIATPSGYEPDMSLIDAANANIKITLDPDEAATNADLIVTDVWASMGQEDSQAQRLKAFERFQVNESLMQRARPDSIFMHCLPAHRGEEVSGGVIDGPQSAVWQEAENRLHAQKALLEYLINGF